MASSDNNGGVPITIDILDSDMLAMIFSMISVDSWYAILCVNTKWKAIGECVFVPPPRHLIFIIQSEDVEAIERLSDRWKLVDPFSYVIHALHSANMTKLLLSKSKVITPKHVFTYLHALVERCSSEALENYHKCKFHNDMYPSDLDDYTEHTEAVVDTSDAESLNDESKYKEYDPTKSKSNTPKVDLSIIFEYDDKDHLESLGVMLSDERVIDAMNRQDLWNLINDRIMRWNHLMGSGRLLTAMNTILTGVNNWFRVGSEYTMRSEKYGLFYHTCRYYDISEILFNTNNKTVVQCPWVGMMLMNFLMVKDLGYVMGSERMTSLLEMLCLSGIQHIAQYCLDNFVHVINAHSNRCFLMKMLKHIIPIASKSESDGKRECLRIIMENEHIGVKSFDMWNYLACGSEDCRPILYLLDYEPIFAQTNRAIMNEFKLIDADAVMGIVKHIKEKRSFLIKYPHVWKLLEEDAEPILFNINEYLIDELLCGVLFYVPWESCDSVMAVCRKWRRCGHEIFKVTDRMIKEAISNKQYAMLNILCTRIENPSTYLRYTIFDMYAAKILLHHTKPNDMQVDEYLDALEEICEKKEKDNDLNFLFTFNVTDSSYIENTNIKAALKCTKFVKCIAERLDRALHRRTVIMAQSKICRRTLTAISTLEKMGLMTPFRQNIGEKYTKIIIQRLFDSLAVWRSPEFQYAALYALKEQRRLGYDVNPRDVLQLIEMSCISDTLKITEYCLSRVIYIGNFAYKYKFMERILNIPSRDSNSAVKFVLENECLGLSQLSLKNFLIHTRCKNAEHLMYLLSFPNIFTQLDRAILEYMYSMDMRWAPEPVMIKYILGSPLIHLISDEDRNRLANMQAMIPVEKRIIKRKREEEAVSAVPIKNVKKNSSIAPY
jgi:hypothetical protein